MRRIPWLLIATALLAPVSGRAQDRTVVGRVLDARTERPIADGRVRVKGSALRDRVRPDGVFVLHVPASTGHLTLDVRAVGYVREEIEVAPGVDAVRVLLARDPLTLDPLTIAAAEPGEGTRLEGAPAASLLEALQGRAAGVDVQRNSGVPGGDFQFRLRGVNTILGSVAPLVVVDGVVLSTVSVGDGTGAVTGGLGGGVSRLLDLGASDIEEIEILEGARASLYGSRGANGVVLIRTNRGPRRP